MSTQQAGGCEAAHPSWWDADAAAPSLRARAGGKCTESRERSRRRVPSCSIPAPGCEGLSEELSAASRRAGGGPPARGCCARRRLQLLEVIRRNLHCHPSPVSPPSCLLPSLSLLQNSRSFGMLVSARDGVGGDKTIWGRSRLQTPRPPSPELPDPRPLQPSSPLPCHSPAEKCSPGSGSRCSSE